MRHCARSTGSLILLAAVVTVFASSGCAGVVQGSRRQPGRVEEGKFVPTRPGAESVGPNPAYTCGTPSLFTRLFSELADQKVAGRPTPVTDGRLCAVAEALLGWDKSESPPERISEFVAWTYGLPAQPTPRVVIATFPSEDPAEISTAFIDPVAQFSQRYPHPLIGLATIRETGKGEQKSGRTATAAGSTKVVLVLQDASVDFQPFPRKLAASTQATLKGKILDPVENAKVFTSDPLGHITSEAVGADGSFQTDVKCGDRAGRILVEIRGERKGASSVLAAFPVQCGSDAPAKIELPGAVALGDLGQQKKALLDLINAERTAAALAPVVQDEAASTVAQAMSDQLRTEADTGSPTKSLDPVAMLKQANVSSPLVLINPGQALTSEEAQARFATSPTLRAHMLSADITHAGIGITPYKGPDGRASVFVIEVFVRELAALPQVDAATTRDALYVGIQKKRAAAKVSDAVKDPVLEAAAQKYAAALAETQGTLSDARGNQIISPLYKKYKAINILSGVKLNPADFAEESGVTGKATVVGIGIAQGVHPSFGKNSVYVVILIGSKR